MAKFISYVLAGILGIWLATGIPEVHFTGSLQSIALAGFVLGIINFAIKPILDIITLPLKILTFGLFSIVLNMGILWVVDVLILDKIFTLWTLLMATLIISILNIFLIKR